jgi:hypothetical protein
MTPYWNAAARGVIIGFSGSTRRGDLYRALPPRPKEATEAPQELVIFGAAPKPDKISACRRIALQIQRRYRCDCESWRRAGRVSPSDA